MTREEAINELKIMRNLYSHIRRHDREWEATELAIEALQERPKGRWIPVHEHMWRKFEGSIDEYAWESGYHNGPVCELCGEHTCINCNPDWEKDECAVESYRCSECNHHVKEKTELCPNCGADMRGEEE